MHHSIFNTDVHGPMHCLPSSELLSAQHANVNEQLASNSLGAPEMSCVWISLWKFPGPGYGNFHDLTVGHSGPRRWSWPNVSVLS